MLSGLERLQQDALMHARPSVLSDNRIAFVCLSG